MPLSRKSSTNLPHSRRKTNDAGGFETTASAFRQKALRGPSSSTFAEDSVSTDHRWVKRIHLNVPLPQRIRQRSHSPLVEIPEVNFDNVSDMQWEDNVGAEDDLDEDDDELEDGAQKARRYASSVRSWIIRTLTY